MAHCGADGMKLRFQMLIGAACSALLLLALTGPPLLPEAGGADGACAEAEHCALYYSLGEWRVVDTAAKPLNGSRHVAYVRNEEDGSWTIYYAQSARCLANGSSASWNHEKGEA
jgi:hypothetical protein